MLGKFNQEEEMEHEPSASRNREPSESEPDNNMNVVAEGDDNNDGSEPQNNQGIDDEEFEDDAFADDEFGPQEFSALNNQLDQLQSALDSLESRNDDIHSKLLELLRSSREIRQVMLDEKQKCSGNPPPDADEGDLNSAAGGSSCNSNAHNDKDDGSNTTV